VSVPDGCGPTYDKYKKRGSYSADYPGARLWSFDQLYSDLKTKGPESCANQAFRQAVHDSEEFWSARKKQACGSTDEACTTPDPSEPCCYAKFNLTYIATRKNQITHDTAHLVAGVDPNCSTKKPSAKNRGDILKVAAAALPTPVPEVKDPCEDLRKANPEIIKSYKNDGTEIPSQATSLDYAKDCLYDFFKAILVGFKDTLVAIFDITPPGWVYNAARTSWMKWKDPTFKNPSEELTALLWDYRDRPAELANLTLQALSQSIDTKLQNFSCLNDYGKLRYLCENGGTVVGMFIPPAGAALAILKVARGGNAAMVAMKEGAVGLKSIAAFAKEAKAAQGAAREAKTIARALPAASDTGKAAKAGEAAADTTKSLPARKLLGAGADSGGATGARSSSNAGKSSTTGSGANGSKAAPRVK
jgi:hypothetical protein